jgi:hypothetical protein
MQPLIVQATLFSFLLGVCVGIPHRVDRRARSCNLEIGLDRDEYSVVEGEMLEVCVEAITGSCDENVIVTISPGRGGRGGKCTYGAWLVCAYDNVF